MLIEHFHASPKEFITKLIAVTSWLDAVVVWLAGCCGSVVAYTNVLYSVEN